MPSNPHQEGEKSVNSRLSGLSAASDQTNDLFRSPESAEVSRGRGNGLNTCCTGHGELDPYEVCPGCATHVKQEFRHI